MSNLRKNSSSNSIDEKFNSTKANKPNKKRLINILISNINYFSLIPTFLYNSIFLYLSINEILKRNTYSSNESCINMEDYLYLIVFWNVFSLVKSFVFIVFSNFLCESEYDCNAICLFLKIITSYIPSIYFINSTKNLMSTVENLISSIESPCGIMINNILMFYKIEKIYFYFISSLFCLFPIMMVMIICKELWKTRKYQTD